MFERFTDRARRAIVLGQDEARMLNHNYVGTEHMVLGLLSEGEGLAGAAMLEADLTLEGLREKVREVIGMGAHPPMGHLPWTPRAKRVLELTLREALAQGVGYIGTEHILLALIHEGLGVGCRAMEECGVNLKELRRQLLARIDETRTPRRVAPRLAATTKAITNYHHLLQVVLDDSGAWVEPFLEWVNGDVDTLDFQGAAVPQRLQDLLAPLRTVEAQ